MLDDEVTGDWVSLRGRPVIELTRREDSRGRVGNESSRHLETSGSNVTARRDSRSNVSLHDPLDHKALS
jgi:hypothetical protein